MRLVPLTHPLDRFAPKALTCLLRAAFFFAFIAFPCAFPAFAQAKAEAPPNFVIILADDLGYGDLGCYGADRTKTPNLDRMAQEGTRFTDFYACASVCTPSRAGLLTGRYPIRSGLTRVLEGLSSGGIDDREITLAQALKRRNYATACIGKWHLGHLPPYLPTRHGFDEYFGLPYSNDTRPLSLMRNEAVIEDPARLETLTQRYTEEAVRFIRQRRNQPFFLYLAHTMPHVPLAVSEAFKGKSAGGIYGDVVEELDGSAGQVREALRGAGLEQNTLVVFTSDNGPWLIKGRSAGSPGPLRGGKNTEYEGGVREPFIACWPGHVPAGRVCSEPGMLTDLFPTFVRLAGGKLPADRPIDGRDISGLLTGGSGPGERDLFFYYGETLHAVRSGRWKYHGRYTTLAGEHAPELYDLQADPGERENLADRFPDRVRELQARLDAFDREAKRTASPVKQ